VCSALFLHLSLLLLGKIRELQKQSSRLARKIMLTLGEFSQTTGAHSTINMELLPFVP
jgi:hypothetical protein